MKQKIDFRKHLIVACFGIVFLVISFNEGMVMAAEKFPEKPIKLLVGYSPGGTSDLMGRMLASLVTEYLGQPVIVVNKPGASATVAAAEVAASKPDGYTLGNLTQLTLSLAPLLLKVKFDPMKSFEPLLNYAGGVYGVCVLSDAPWNSFKELIEFARRNPGELSVSSPGVGTQQHIVFEWIARQEKISWKHVPYPGGAPAATALLGGHVKCNFGSGSHLPFVESGKFKLLASYSTKRNPKNPDVPTLKELGYDLPISNGQIIAAPKGVPEPILKTLEDAFSKAGKSEVFKEFLNKMLMEHDFRDRENVKKLIETEYTTWVDILDKLDLKIK
jgi:tripartite-type tricarboxylate transporter receptor subunit TctC